MKKFKMLFVVIMVVALIAGCAQKPTIESPTQATEAPVISETSAPTEVQTVAVESDRVLNLMSNEAIGSLDPFESNSLRTKWICRQIYEGLIYYNFEDRVVEPLVAEKYEVSPDGLTYTFTLRDGVKFQNGDPVTVKDVVFSYTRAQKGTAMGNHVAAIDSFSAPDDKTFVVKLKYPSAPFLQYVSQIYIMSESFVKKYANVLTDVALGTGPYMVDDVDRAVLIQASAFPDYYRGEAKIKKINWNIITDSAAAAMSLQAGDLDYLEVSWSQVAELKTDPNLKTGFLPTLHTSYLAFNTSKAPFDNVKVRQGIAYLINRDDIVAVAFEGYAEVDSLVMHPDLQGMPSREFLKQFEYTYDPEKGLALLREAGFDTSKEIDLGAILTLPESHYLFKPAQVIQAELAKYNIKVTLQPEEAATMFADFFGGKYTMAVCGGSYGADASGYATVLGSSKMGQLGGNATYWTNDSLDELFTKGVAEIDPEKRQEIYGEIMKILFDNVPMTGVGHKRQTVAWGSTVNVVLRLDYPLIYEWSFND